MVLTLELALTRWHFLKPLYWALGTPKLIFSTKILKQFLYDLYTFSYYSVYVRILKHSKLYNNKLINEWMNEWNNKWLKWKIMLYGYIYLSTSWQSYKWRREKGSKLHFRHLGLVFNPLSRAWANKRPWIRYTWRWRLFFSSHFHDILIPVFRVGLAVQQRR